MTEWIVQPNPSATYTKEDGTEAFGQPQWAYRREGDHNIVYSGVSADEPQPGQSPQEHLQAEHPDYEPEPHWTQVAVEDEGKGQEPQQPGAEGNA